MLYTLAGAAKATGLGTAMILAAIEEGRIAANQDLFGEWHIEGSDLHRLYPPIATSVVRAEASQRSRTASATNLEAEIAAVIRTAGDELRHDDGNGFYDVEPVLLEEGPRSAAPTTEAGLPSATPPGPSSSSGSEIRVGDRDKILGFTLPACSEYSRIAALAAALSLTFGIGWIAGLSSHQLLWRPAAAERSPTAPAAETSQTRIRSSRADPQAVRRGKIRAAAEPANAARETTQSIGPAAATNRTAATAAQNALNRRAASAGTSLRAVPETRPTTIEGWTVRDVVEGIAVLEGPEGIWKAARGDTVPGLGRIHSIVLWGNRWIVATSTGLITTE